MYFNFTNSSRGYLLLFISFFIINIASAQTANFTVNNTSQCLTGNNFIFTNTSSNSATAYQWNFGDGTTSTAISPVKAYTAYGTFSVQLIATIGGINYYTNKTVEVNAQPQCSFTYYAATGTGNSYSFQSTSSIGSGSMNYSWDFGDGGTATSSNPSYTYLANGTYSVTLTVTSDKGCISSTMQTVVVTVSSGGYSPNLSFVINNNSQCLTGNSFKFTNTTAAIFGASYRWDFGDGGTSTLANPTHSYGNAGSYTVSLIATIASVDYTVTKIVNVSAVPTITISGTACTGSTLTATTSATNISAIQWKNGASVVQTNTAVWSNTSMIVAGNNGQGSATNQFVSYGTDVYVDKQGNIYVIDDYQSKVKKFAAGSTNWTLVAKGLQITGLGVDDAGNLYTVDDINNWVQKWTPGSLTPTTVAGGNGLGNAANQLHDPRGNLYIDASGNIYINDFLNNRIQKWAVGATFGTTVAGGNGQGSAPNQLNYAKGFFVDAAGNIYVADRGNARISYWAVGATFGTTVAGGNGQGSAANQFLSGPQNVWVDAAGNIFATDNEENRMRVFTVGAADGVVVFNGGSISGNLDLHIIYLDQQTGCLYQLSPNYPSGTNVLVNKYCSSTISQTYVPTTAGTYTAAITTFGGCSATSNSIVVNTTPTVAAISGASNVCVGSSTTLANTTIGGTWTSSNTNIATVNSIGVVTGVSAGTVTMTYTVNNGGCIASVTKNIVMNALPAINISGGGSCASTLTANISGGVASNLVWSLNGTPQDTVYNTYNPSATTVAGGNGSGNAANQLNGAIGIFVDAFGNLFVADNNNNRVQKFASGSTIGVTVAGGNGTGSALNQLNPGVVFVDGTGNIYATDGINGRVLKFPYNITSATNGVLVAGGNGVGNAANQLGSSIFGIFVDAAGNIYVSDANNHRVMRWDVGATTGVTVAGGNGQGNAANQLNFNWGIYVDAAANVYVADAINYRIQKWASVAITGVTVAGALGSGPPDSAHLSFVTDVVVDALGTMYISDYFNRITRWQDGVNYGTVIAGTNYSGGSGASEFQYANSLTFDTNGNLYVSDGNNNRVQKFTVNSLTNTFTPTVAGTYCVTANSYAGCSASACNVVSSIGVTPTIQINTGVSCSNATICAGSSVTFNSSIINGGASPTIQWKVNGSNVATGASFATSSLNNNDVVTAVLTSNAACISSNSVTSNSITIATKVSPTVTVTGSGCTGNSLSLTGTSLSGSSITWLVGGVPMAASTPSIDTNAVTVAGGLSSGSGASQLNNQQGIFVDASNNLYIADFGNDRVQKWANNAVTGVTIAGGNGQGLASNQTNGYGLFVDKNNNLYTVESLHRVQKWAPNTTNGVTIAGTGFSGNSATQFTLPKSVHIDDCGNMYVADTYNHRVQKFSNGSTVGVTVAGTGVSGNSATQLSYPTHVQVDALGNIYVADNGNNRIQKFAANSLTATTVAGTGISGSTNNQLNSAWGMFVDGGGNIYVADTYNNRIMYWAYGATTGVKIAGTGNYGNGANGLNYPTHVFVDADGNVYVSDSHNNRVQKFSAIVPVSVTPSTAGTYTATVSNIYGCSVTSNPVTLANCVTPTISIASGSGNCQSNICAGTSPTFTTSATNIGASPTYQWKVNGSNAGSNSSTFTTSALNNNDIVTCDIKNNDVGAYPNFVTSNSITVTVNALPTISLSGSNCINNPITVTTNTGISSVVWTLNASPVFTAAPSWNLTGITVAGGTNGNAANQLRSPTDVLVDNSGIIYVADLFNNRIQKFPSNSLAGTSATTVAGQSNGTGGSTLTTLNNPHGFTLDANGNIYITNSANHRVDKWLANAATGITVAGTGTNGSAANQFFIPRRMVLDGCGNMYITDTYNHRVQKWAVGATSGVTVAGGNGQGNASNQLKFPTDVALDAQGNLYVADADNHRVQKFPANSTSATNGVTVAGNGGAGSSLNQLDEPQGIYVDALGNLYVADANNVRIMYWANGASTGVLIAGGNGYGSAANQLNYPTNVTLDKNGNLYVADEHNDRIQKFTVGTSSYTPTTAGIYTVTATSNNGCVASQNITINSCLPNPSPSFISNATSQCIIGNSFVFTNTSTAPSGTTYLWNFGDGTTSTSTNPTHNYSTVGYFNVQMIASYNGQNFYANSLGIYVGAKPVSGFAQYYNSSLTYTFNSTSSISTGSISSYVWNFGDGGTATTSNPQHSFASASTYNVKLVVTSDAGCRDSTTTAVVISNSSGGGSGNVTLNPSFTTNLTNQCITGNNFAFTNISTAPNGTAYLWNFGDNTSSTVASPTHIYTNSGYYNVQMIATYNGQSYYANSQSIFVGAKPVAGFNTITGTGSGNAHTFISTSTIANGSMNYAWDLGDGTTYTQVSPQHIYAIAGTVNVKLVVTSDLGCKDSIIQAIVICPTFNNQAFSINAASSCFVGNYFGVQNYFGNNAGYPMTYLWNYGDGFTTTAQNPPYHNYAAAGNYIINLTTSLAYPGCTVKTATYSLPATVYPMPVASFNISGSPTTMCYTPTNNYTFNNTSTVASGNANYAWNFGDTTYSNLYSPTHSYSHAGIQTWDTNAHRIYTKLIATSNQGCKDSISKYVVLYPLPVANKLVISSYVGSIGFPLYNGPTYFANPSYPNDTIQCFNQRNWFGNALNGYYTSTSDMTTYNFGDGTSSTNFCCGVSHGAPYKVYTAAGTYNVSAYITTSYGCVSQTVNNKIILTPNTDSLPHSVIGLHPEVTTNVGVDPSLGHSYNHYKLFYANLGSTACRPIIASYWRISYISGNSYWNHGYFDLGPYAGILPATTDSAYFGFDADTNNVYAIRLITMNDLGMRDTAYATFGATNNGYTNYRIPSFVAANVKVDRNIAVYPNPARNTINIAIKLEKNYHTNVVVYNALGQKVLANQQFLFGNIVQDIKLNINALNSGNYYIQITDDSGNILANTKFIKAN